MILTGPTGVGKNAVLEGILSRDQNINKVVTCTTRPIRKGIEEDGVDYKFVTQEQFDGMDLIAKANLEGKFYGVCKDDLLRVLSGEDLVLIIDPKAALNIRETLRDTETFDAEAGQRLEESLLVIAIMPPDENELWERFSERARASGSEASAQASFQTRIKKDYEVLKNSSNFPNVVINRTGHLEDTVVAIDVLINSKRTALNPKTETK